MLSDASMRRLGTNMSDGGQNVGPHYTTPQKKAFCPLVEVSPLVSPRKEDIIDRPDKTQEKPPEGICLARALQPSFNFDNTPVLAAARSPHGEISPPGEVDDIYSSLTNLKSREAPANVQVMRDLMFSIVEY